MILAVSQTELPCHAANTALCNGAVYHASLRLTKQKLQLGQYPRIAGLGLHGVVTCIW